MSGTGADSVGAVILGVDDDLDQLILLQQQIEGAGYTFFGATGGEEALKLARRIAPKLIILDVLMRGMDGYETCMRFRLDNGFAKVPILLLTADHTRAAVLRGRSVGASDFLVKPLGATQLDARIRHWLARAE